MLKTALFTSLLALSFSPVALNNDAPFKPIHDNVSKHNQGDFMDYTSLFFNVGSMGFDANDKGVLVGQYFGDDIFMSFVLGNVDDAFYWGSVPGLNVRFENVSVDDASFYYSPLQISGVTLTNEEWFNFQYINITFDYFSATNTLEFIFRGWRIVNSMSTSFSFSIEFVLETDKGIVFDTNYLSNYSFTFFNNVDVRNYFDAYTDGYTRGNNDGLNDGYDIGYNEGYNIGLTADFDAFGWLTAIFTGMGAFLSIQLLPNVSIGGIAILIMVLTLVPFLIGLLKGGKS